MWTLRNTLKNLLWTSALLCCSVLAASAGETVVEEIIARVNNSIITRSEMQRNREQLLQEARQQNIPISDPRVVEQEKNLLRDLIDQQLLLQKGQELGITGDAELVRRLDDIRKQMKLETMEDMEKAAKQQGVSYEDFKQNLRNQIITQQVIGRDVGSRIRFTHEEIQQYYEAHKSELEQPEQVRLSEILVSTSEGEGTGAGNTEPDSQLLAEAKASAERLLEEIRKGAKFEDVAKRSSDGPTAQQGGDLGYFKRGMLAKELEDQTFALKAGQVTDVIRTKQGYIILKVTEHNQAGVPPLKEVEGQIQNALYVEKLQPALRNYLTKLREEAYIDIKPGYIDTAASPNQTKPIMTTASTSSTATKEEKKKEKSAH